MALLPEVIPCQLHSQVGAISLSYYPTVVLTLQLDSNTLGMPVAQ